MGLTSSKIAYRGGFGPFAPGSVVTKYPYCLRCLAKPAAVAAAGGGESKGAAVCCGGALEDLEQLLKQVRRGKKTKHTSKNRQKTKAENQRETERGKKGIMCFDRESE